MRIGIVGSRRFKDRAAVEKLVEELPRDSVIVSGGCRGVDKWAVEKARELGMETKEHLPKLTGCVTKWDYTQAYFARNKKIANDCQILYAFVAEDRTGGTENTIKHATEAGIKIVLKGGKNEETNKQHNDDN